MRLGGTDGWQRHKPPIMVWAWSALICVPKPFVNPPNKCTVALTGTIFGAHLFRPLSLIPHLSCLFSMKKRRLRLCWNLHSSGCTPLWEAAYCISGPLRLIRGMTSPYRPVGETDSEAAFCFILNSLVSHHPEGVPPSTTEASGGHCLRHAAIEAEGGPPFFC